MPLGQTSNQDNLGSTVVTEEASGLDGAAAPAKSLQVAGKDPSGNLQTLSTDTNGVLNISSKSFLSPGTPTAVSVGVTSTILVSFNAARKGLIVTNISANKVSLNLLAGTAVINTGITLYPGWIWEMDEYTMTDNTITAIASAASSVLTIQEFS